MQLCQRCLLHSSIAAAGILQGILIVAKIFFPTFENTGTYEVFNFISWAPFTFLPIFIATAAKHFKVNTYIAVACCAALVSPDLTDIVEKLVAVNHLHLLVFL